MHKNYSFSTVWIDHIFSGLDGEGSFAGEPCVFVRFYGCSKKCSFCDTVQNRAVPISIPDLVLEICGKYPLHNRIAITGGEPLEQYSEVSFLSFLLKAEGKEVILHTSLSPSEAIQFESPENEPEECIYSSLDGVAFSPKGDFYSCTGNHLSKAVEWVDKLYQTGNAAKVNLKLLVSSPENLVRISKYLQDSFQNFAARIGDAGELDRIRSGLEITFQAITPPPEDASGTNIAIPRWIFEMWEDHEEVSEELKQWRNKNRQEAALYMSAIKRFSGITPKILPQIHVMTMQKSMPGI